MLDLTLICHHLSPLCTLTHPTPRPSAPSVAPTGHHSARVWQAGEGQGACSSPAWTVGEGGVRLKVMLVSWPRCITGCLLMESRQLHHIHGVEPTSRIQLSVSLVFDWPSGLHWWLSGKESADNAGDLPEMQLQSLGQEDILEKRAWKPPLVFLPGKSHGQRSLVGCRPRGRKELDVTEAIEHAHPLRT